MDWKDMFSQKLYELTGHLVTNYNIHSDEKGWYYYIQSESLEENHPLILNHYRGQLFAVIPLKEYLKLENGTIAPDMYIDNAFWSFGYYWGGGSMINGVFWKPLEESAGIHDKKLVNRYLSILACRTHRRSCGYMPAEEQCQRCFVNQCPFSEIEEKNRGASWENEVDEHDYRVDMFRAVKERTKAELNLDLAGLLCHKGETALLIPHSWKKETCTLYLPVALTNELLYHPGERNWNELAKDLKIELGVLFDKSKRAVIDDEIDGHASEFCREFWESCCTTDTEKKESTQVAKEMKPNIFKKVMSFLGVATK